MLNVKAREAADTIFQVFGMIQLRIKPVYHASQTNALTKIKVKNRLFANLTFKSILGAVYKRRP